MLQAKYQIPRIYLYATFLSFQRGRRRADDNIDASAALPPATMTGATWLLADERSTSSEATKRHTTRFWTTAFLSEITKRCVSEWKTNIESQSKDEHTMKGRFFFVHATSHAVHSHAMLRARTDNLVGKSERTQQSK